MIQKQQPITQSKHEKRFCSKFKFFYESKKEYLKKYGEKNKARFKEYDAAYDKMWTTKYKTLALQKISLNEGFKEILCFRCGFEDIKFLQINHKNYCGQRELKSARSFYRRVALMELGDKRLLDFSVLCSVCNWTEYIEKKLKVKYSIKFCKEV